LSSNADQRFFGEARKIGVRAYIARTEEGKALVKAIEAALRGDDFVLME
jgi:DNA-binding NarL/FixJ family response regulator